MNSMDRVRATSAWKKPPRAYQRGLGADKRSVIGWEKGGNRSTIAVFDEPEWLRFRGIGEDLEVVNTLVLLREALEGGQAGEDHVAVGRERRGSGKERLLVARLEAAVGGRIIERNLLWLESGERHDGKVKGKRRERGENLAVPAPASAWGQEWTSTQTTLWSG
jgi:hypothetical protein